MKLLAKSEESETSKKEQQKDVCSSSPENFLVFIVSMASMVFMVFKSLVFMVSKNYMFFLIQYC